MEMLSISPLRFFPALCIGAAALGGGCLEAPQDDVVAETEVSAAVQAANGISVNGISVNGISVNGTSLSGASIVGVSLFGISVNGASVNLVGVIDSELQGLSATGKWLDGADWVGAELTGFLTDHSAIRLRIDGTARLPAPSADVRSYAISYQTASGWRPVCPNANEAIAFPGTWNLTTIRHQWDWNMFSLGCRGATFAKCVELGYRGSDVLDTYHQACVRAIRADYCGDGTSYTITGTEINIFDKLGRQADTQSWAVESNWTPDGATCINKARVLTSLSEPNVPACVASRAATACNTSAWQGHVLLRTEVNK